MQKVFIDDDMRPGLRQLNGPTGLNSMWHLDSKALISHYVPSLVFIQSRSCDFSVPEGSNTVLDSVFHNLSAVECSRKKKEN